MTTDFALRSDIDLDLEAAREQVARGNAAMVRLANKYFVSEWAVWVPKDGEFSDK